ncbi:MAG TPA: serine hydrolase domain-containing protein [Verrucomicrobiota bacterium]|nr:serine hydrolase [Verrucomicrobiales bacterium]HRI15771.1 serine hydrolase domain-containing protein [Verrucomicrobiota bacterium]
MHPVRLFAALAISASLSAFADAPKLPGVGAAMQEMIAKNEIAGAVTVVVTKDKLAHLEATGFANVAAKQPMTPDTLFWIASMTKPITAVAVLMLQDEGKLNVADPVAKYLPGFADLKTPSGKPANLTITQILTHTSGLGEASGPAAQQTKTLADLVPIWLAAPMQFEPGAKWSYCQSGINAAARIVEVVSGMTFDAFLQKRLFDPLGMKQTTFYLTDDQRANLVTAYAKNKDTGVLEPVPPRPEFGPRDRPPQGNGGLYSTPHDYARFCQMLLNGGTFDGRRFLTPAAMKFLTTPQTGDLPTGFFQNDTYGQRGKNYGWALGTCVLRAPHDGVAAMLSPGSYGHGGAWGTQAWIDPVKGVAYILMVQRSNFPNSDASDVRREFQQAAANALAKQ